MMTRKDHIAIAKGINATEITPMEKVIVARNVAAWIEPLSKNFDLGMFIAFATAFDGVNIDFPTED